MKYSVLDEGRLLEGSAERLLEQIRQEGAANAPELDQMTVDQYASALIDEAPYVLSRQQMEALRGLRFGSKYDQALTYLSTMPTSGIHIVATESEAISQNGAEQG
jgi:hypothetical protein